MKTKKRIQRLENDNSGLLARVICLENAVASLILRHSETTTVIDRLGWKKIVEEPFTTGTPLYPNPTIVSVDDDSTSSTVTNKDNVPFN